MTQWVADTGPVLHLAEAGALGLLPLLGEIALPSSVHEELRLKRDPVNLPAEFRILPLIDRHLLEAEDWCKAGLVHRGEAQAIALARQIRADVFLTDDAAARLLATSLGLQARGSLGVILWLAGQQKISHPEASRHLENLAQTSLWVSSRVMTEARSALEKLRHQKS
jgi:predicted nucleic acid-binding protein